MENGKVTKARTMSGGSVSGCFRAYGIYFHPTLSALKVAGTRKPSAFGYLLSDSEK